MEQGSLIGLLLVIIGIFIGAFLKHVNPVFLFSIPAAILIVVVASVGATMMSFKMSDTSGIVKVIMTAMKGKKLDRVAMLKKVVDFARRARTDGILSLESEVDKIDDPFLRKGLRMAIDGVDPDDVAATLSTDTAQMKARHKVGAAWCMQIGIYAPTFGIIGAVLGLIAVLGELGGGGDDMLGTMGAGIAAAFVATFWGVFLANGLFIPFSTKLKRLSEEEVAYRQMITEGVLAIQNGVNPRVVEEGLISFLTPAEQKVFRSQSGGK